MYLMNEDINRNVLSKDLKPCVEDNKFFHAAYDNDTETMKKLIDMGIDLSYRGRMDESVLDIAAFNGNLEMVSLLLMNGANVNGKDRLGYTVLDQAERGGDAETISFIILQGGINSPYFKERPEV